MAILLAVCEPYLEAISGTHILKRCPFRLGRLCAEASPIWGGCTPYRQGMYAHKSGGVRVRATYIYYIYPEHSILRLRFPFGKGSRVALEGASREQRGALRREQKRTSWGSAKAPRGEPEMAPSISARAALFFCLAPPAAYLTREVLEAQDRGATLVE